MKFRLFNSKGKFSPTLSLGKVMWRCTDGHPNFETEYSVSCFGYKHMNKEKVYPIPSLYILRWHKGVLSSIEDLGRSSGSVSIGIEWWNFQCSIMFLKVKHTKTTEQINEGLNKKGLSPVL